MATGRSASEDVWKSSRKRVSLLPVTVLSWYRMLGKVATYRGAIHLSGKIITTWSYNEADEHSYFLFAATLIVLSNEFSKLYDTPAAQSCIQSALNITAYCGETDPLARRLLFILTSFRDVVNRQQDSSRLRYISEMNAEDPISSLFTNNIMSPMTTFTSQRTCGSGNIPNGRGIAARKFSSSAGLTNSADPTISALPPSISLTDKSPTDPLIPTLATEPLGGANSEHGPCSVDGSDGFGDVEIDFDAFWNMPMTGLTPANVNTPLPTPGGLNFVPTNIQGISDSIVPLYGMTEFGGA